MKKAKKTVSLILTAVMLISIIITAPTTASAESYEYALFPGDTLFITQGAYGEYNAFSHNGENGYVQNAFDMGGNSVYKAPFTGTIVKVGTSYNVVAIASENKVYWADGTLDYLTVYFMHDNNISDITDGARITQGTPFYHPGSAGGNYGEHLHMYAKRGRITAKNMYGGSGDVYVNNALYIKNTTSVVQTGGYSWKTAPTVTTPTLTSDFSGNKVNSANDIIFSWSTVSSNMSGYNLYVAKNIAGTVNYDWNNGRIYCPGVSTNRFTIDKGKLSAGSYAAFVQAINIDTNEKSPQSNYIYFVVEDSIISDIHTPYDGITIDLSENNFLSIRGWALNTGRYEVNCYATIDEGEELFLQKSERTDVSTSPLYSCYCSNSNVGFQSQIDISELSGGQHNLKIIAKSTSVNAIIADYSFTIINKTEPTATQQTTVEPTEPTSNGPTQPTTVKATETIEPTQSTTKPTEITEPTQPSTTKSTEPIETQPTTVEPTEPTEPTQSTTKPTEITEPTQPSTTKSTEPIETQPATVKPTEPTEPTPDTEEKTDISKWQVSGIYNKQYTGKYIKQDGITVYNDGEYADIKVKYRNNLNAGTATVIITGTGDYTGTITKTFKINKAENPMLTWRDTEAVSSKALKKHKVIVKGVIGAYDYQGSVTFTKLSGSKSLTISKGGVITVKKGRYKKNSILSMKVKITAKGNANYMSKSKKMTVKIKIK